MAADQEYAPPPGFERVDLGTGYSAGFGAIYLRPADATIGFRVASSHANPSGVCHGGAMATFADAQIIVFRPGAAQPPAHTPTISLSLDYLAPAPVGAWVEAAVTLVKATRSMLFTQAIITVDGGAVARATAIYRNHEQAGA